jgi:hypothetical protein
MDPGARLQIGQFCACPRSWSRSHPARYVVWAWPGDGRWPRCGGAERAGVNRSAATAVHVTGFVTRKWIRIVRQGVTACSCRRCRVRGCALRAGHVRGLCPDGVGLAVNRLDHCGDDHPHRVAHSPSAWPAPTRCPSRWAAAEGQPRPMCSSRKPAIGHGGPSRNGCPPIGQRGVTRPQGPACKTGANELAPLAAPPQGWPPARPSACGFPLGRQAPREGLLP